MADVLIRNIDKETHECLKKIAISYNRSLQEELKELADSYAKPDVDESRLEVFCLDSIINKRDKQNIR